MTSQETELPQLPFYDQPTPLAITHRGGNLAGAVKENSLAAFASAWAAGVINGETDAVATRDSYALAIHGSSNRWFQRRTGLPIRASLEAMTLDEIDREVRIGGEKVPLLEEVLRSFPDMRFFIDPKTANSVKPVAEVIRRTKAYDRVSVGAFNWERTRGVVEQLDRKGRICTTIGSLASLSLLTQGLHNRSLRRYIGNAEATQFALPFNHVRPNMIELAHDLGKRVLLWTPNREVDIWRSFASGSDGVMSDETIRVRDAARAYQAAHRTS